MKPACQDRKTAILTEKAVNIKNNEIGEFADFVLKKQKVAADVPAKT